MITTFPGILLLWRKRLNSVGPNIKRLKKVMKMILTKKFQNTVSERAKKDGLFRKALLKEAVNALRSNEIEVAKSLLRTYNL
ncbi:hypothetical protein [Legionella massiliensis]|nr:hypothetical protein [Legionella massiliensis]